MDGNYNPACPLCLLDVDTSFRETYRILPRDQSRVALVRKRPNKPTFPNLSVGKFAVSPSRDRSKVPQYSWGAWLLHKRCLNLVQDLHISKLYHLLDVVEPTFHNHRWPPQCSLHGAFHSSSSNLPKHRHLTSVKTPSNNTRATTLLKKPWITIRDSLLGTTNPKGREKTPVKLPIEIWNMILEYDIGRLQFILKTAREVSRKSSIEIPRTRFTIEMLDLRSPIIRIYPVYVGKRLYIGHISNPTENTPRDAGGVYALNGDGYLAVKSDGIGVVDISFQQLNNQPKWILNNSTQLFETELLQIRDNKKIEGLRIIRDSQKCRAIIPSDRIGAEPFFSKTSFPPEDCFVDSGFVSYPQLTRNNPFAYCTSAAYISFASLKKFAFSLSKRNAIQNIYVNGPEVSEGSEHYEVHFPQPPTRMKHHICSMAFVHHHPFFQFEVNQQWLPPLPIACISSSEILVNNAVGIWYDKTFSFNPLHIGIVVSRPEDRMNTLS